jgi:hypothetical protein
MYIDSQVGFLGLGNKAKRQERRATRKAKRAVKKTARQTTRAAKKTVRQQKRAERGGSRLKKVALAPARIAFITALRLNLLKVASKLAAGYQRNPQAVKKFAARFGYKWSNFAQALAQGSKQTISGPQRNAQLGDVSAVIAAALPIIVALPALFKLLNIGRDGEQAQLEMELEKGGVDLNNVPDFYAGDPEPGADYFDPASEGIDTNFLLLAGAAVAAIFVLPKFFK